MSILITGGLGHIGSALIQELYLPFTVVDNFHTQRYCSLIQCRRPFRFIEDDFKNLTTNFLRQFDTVIHLAAIVDATKSFKNKSLVKKVNDIETAEFFDKCHNAYVKRVIFPSSTSVYGPQELDVDETCTNFNPQSPYAEYKLQIEKFLLENKFNFIPTILRLGTIAGYSPGIRFQTACQKFCWQAINRQPLSVWKSAFNLVRPYLSLTDAISVFKKSTRVISSEPELFNILTDNLTLKSIINTVARFRSIELNFIEDEILNQHSYYVLNKKSLTKGLMRNKTGIDLEIRNILTELCHINQ